jgi:cytochrome c biogenesis protein CcdA
MDSALFVALGGAFWLGILLSLSPCPLASNLAMVAFLARRVSDPFAALRGGILYGIGRGVAYVFLAALPAWGLASLPRISAFLQGEMGKLLGPLFILTGMVLLELLAFPSIGKGIGMGVQERLSRLGDLGTFLLGALLALSFCPVSAALFFGNLLPLVVKTGSFLALPAAFGLGSALPAVGAAFLVAYGLKGAGKAFGRIQAVEKVLRISTGTVLVLLGLFLSLRDIFGVTLLRW